MSKNLSRHHPDYDATLAARTISRDLYEGDEDVKAKETTYLIQGKNEEDADYALRLARAALDPFAEKIVDARQALLFLKTHTRELPATLEAYMDDIDLKGTPASVFFADAGREAQVDGIHWVLVDMPRAPVDDDGNPTVRSALDEKEAGLRPFFEHVPGGAVIDWAVGEDRKLLFTVTETNSEEPRAEDDFGEEPVYRDQWTVWTRSAWYVYATKTTGTGGNTKSTVEIIDEGVHSLGVVPMIPFFGVRRTDYSGWPVTRSVNPFILQIYNKESDLDRYEQISAHPIPCVIAKEKPEEMLTGGGFFIPSVPEYQTEVFFLETNGKGFESLRLSIRSKQSRIFSIALAQAMRDSAQTQSADAQREDRKIFAASLKSVSVSLEASEQRCWEIMGVWEQLGDSEIDNIEISYSRDFDNQMIESAMIQALSALVMTDQLPVRELWDILKTGEILPSDFDNDEAEKAIEAAEARKFALVDETLAAEGGDEDNE